jgi:hypothetical protein
MTTQTGFKQDQTGSYIQKDPGATLVYTIDWSDWMSSGDTISNSSYTVSTITSDPAPMTIVDSGYQSGNSTTYVELAAGSSGNIYTVTNQITTSNGSIDRRRYRIKVNPRYL